MDINRINVLVLAYIGDAIYETHIRENLVKRNIDKVNILQNESIKYVSAKAQTKYLKMMLDNKFLNEDEINIVMRARNNKNASHPKNTDIVTYKWATGLEALIGYLYLNKSIKRIDEIMNYIVELGKV
jgi:ribonuclease-3 family protein